MAKVATPVKATPKPKPKPELAMLTELANKLVGCDTSSFVPCVSVDLDEWTAFKWVVKQLSEGTSQPGEDPGWDLHQALLRLVVVLDHSHSQMVETIPKSVWDEVRAELLRYEQGDA